MTLAELEAQREALLAALSAPDSVIYVKIAALLESYTDDQD
jgi:hypothetical protein